MWGDPSAAAGWPGEKHRGWSRPWGTNQAKKCSLTTFEHLKLTTLLSKTFHKETDSNVSKGPTELVSYRQTDEAFRP